MFAAFKAFFSVFTSLFTGAEKYADAFNKSGDWAVESMNTFVEKAEHERAVELIKFRAEIKAKELEAKTKAEAKPLAKVA